MSHSPGWSRELSYSSFSTYEDCPQRWKFRYVDGLDELPRPYFSFGRSMHLALEAFVGPLVEPGAAARGQLTLFHFGDYPPVAAPMSAVELLEQYERSWISEGFASRDEEQRYYLTGRDLLKRFRSEYLASRPRTIAVEKELSGSMDGVKIHGIIDRIDVTGNQSLEVVDYKTSKELSVEDARNSDQLTFYQLLVEQSYDLPVETLTLYHLRSLKPLRSPPRSEKERDDLAARAGVVVDGMAKGDYEPKPGSQCKWCDFKSRCPAFRK